MVSVRKTFAGISLPPAAPPELRPRRPAPASGFTMIEILIVIGVLVILAAIVLVGMRSITGRSKEQQTKLSMQNLVNMVAEYNARTRLKAPREWLWWPPGGNASLVSIAGGNLNNLDFWRVPQRMGGPTSTPTPMPTIGSVVENGPDREKKAVVNTAIAMILLTQLPENRNALQTFQDRLMQIDDVTVPPTSYDESQARIPMDAWGNPIILVPGSGIWGIETGGQFVTEDNPIKSPDNQPFWASAGPDGDFAKGDDNIYSFDE